MWYKNQIMVYSHPQKFWLFFFFTYICAHQYCCSPHIMWALMGYTYIDIHIFISSEGGHQIWQFYSSSYTLESERVFVKSETSPLSRACISSSSLLYENVARDAVFLPVRFWGVRWGLWAGCISCSVGYSVARALLFVWHRDASLLSWQRSASVARRRVKPSRL